jgi:effector-binding domain-containing protein
MATSRRLQFLAGAIFAIAVLAASFARAQDPQPNAAPAEAGRSQRADPFGEEVMLPEITVVFIEGEGKWDNAYETLIDAFRKVYALMEQREIKPAGRPMMIYSGGDDSGFHFQAAVPIAGSLNNPPQGAIAVGVSPGGKTLKFVHRGSYDTIDSTYEAITNYLDEKNIDAKEIFIEEYVTDPLSTPQNDLLINVYVPIK